MPQKVIQISFFAVLTAGLSVLLFFILKPYIGVIFISGVFAIVFYPLYKRLIDKFNGRKNLASLATTLLILIFIVIPIVAMSALLLREAVGLYNSIALNGSSQSFLSQADALVNKFDSFFPSGIADSKTNLELYVRDTLNWIIKHFDSVFIAVFGGILNFILMIISLYYLFIYGDGIKKGLTAWSPLPDKYDEEFIQTLISSINAVMRGRILISIIQGIFVGIGFAIFGVGSPVLWGFVGAIASLVPILGTSIIIVPAVAYLFLSHSFGAGIGLIVWGTLAVGLIDNVIPIIFLREKIKIHPLIVLFSILGGVEIFGVIGFLVGPVVISAFVALMEIYPFIMSYKKSEAQM